MDEVPRRLIDDPEVSSSLRDDLARAGEQHHAYAAAYDAASKAAGFQLLLATQGGAAPGMGLVAKLALGTVAAAAFMFAGAALYARLYAPSDAAAHRAATAPTAAPAPPAPAATPQVAESPKAPAAEPERTAPQAPASLARRDPRDGTQQEIRQLARIRAHMQSGDVASALQLAERGQRELGESALWQEREALAVLALFELGRTQEAEQRSGGLLARFPNSPFRAELERRARRAHAQ